MRKSTEQMRKEFARARSIAKSLGYFTAARYMAKRGYSIEAATFILLGKEARS